MDWTSGNAYISLFKRNKITIYIKISLTILKASVS